MTSLEESIKSILSNYAGITFDVHEAADGAIEVKIEAGKTVQGGVASWSGRFGSFGVNRVLILERVREWAERLNSGDFKYCISSE